MLFMQAEVHPSHYALLMLILLVLHAHLYSWFGTISYNGAGGKPGLPHNLCQQLDGYLAQWMDTEHSAT